MHFAELCDSKNVLLLDGAMGTELLRHGVDIGAPLWSANAILRAPHMVRNIHFWYLHAGADLLTTNTFRSNPRALKKAGMFDRWEELNLKAMEFAFEARDRYRSSRPVLIAGGMAPVEDCYAPGQVPPAPELRDEHGAQAALLAQLGADMLLAETLTTVREAEAAAQACSATGKPFLVSVTCRNDGRLLSGEPLQEAVHAVTAFGPSALLVNCVSILHLRSVHRLLAEATDLPTGCYANVGTPPQVEAGTVSADQAEAPSTEMHTGTTLTVDASVQDFIEETLRIVDDGARIVGGCCGTTPGHLRGMAEQLCPASLEVDERPDRRATHASQDQHHHREIS